MRLRLLVAAEHGLTSRPGRYLDSVIHLSYVLLRMLEKYSKSKAFMYVRKKKSKAKKRKGERDPVSWTEYDELTCCPRRSAKKPDEEEGDGIGQGDEEEEEMDRGALSYGEHAFEFEKFEAVSAIRRRDRDQR